MPQTRDKRLPTSHIPPFGLRMQADLRERLERAATAAGRSLNSEIVKRLEDSFSGTAVSADDVVAKAEGSDVVELIALQKIMADMYTSQQAYLTAKIFDLLDANGELEKYKSEESSSWLKLSPPRPGQELTDEQFSIEIARTKKE